MPSFSTPAIDQIAITLLKNFFVLGSLLYIIFAIVVLRQIIVMKKTLITTFNPALVILGYVHLAFAILAFIFYISIF